MRPLINNYNPYQSISNRSAIKASISSPCIAAKLF